MQMWLYLHISAANHPISIKFGEHVSSEKRGDEKSKFCNGP